jgi:hypothetical protein
MVNSAKMALLQVRAFASPAFSPPEQWFKLEDNPGR